MVYFDLKGLPIWVLYVYDAWVVGSSGFVGEAIRLADQMWID